VSALVSDGWDAALAALRAGDAEALEQVRRRALELQEEATGRRARREAEVLARYCEHCLADDRGVRNGPAILRLFPRQRV
jgi:hypothetical protein